MPEAKGTRGLEDVVAASTRCSRVDGGAGALWIGGYPVEELAPRAEFEEVCFLLWEGRLPRKAELDALREAMAARRAVPAAVRDVLAAAARAGLGPMEGLALGLASLPMGRPELARTDLAQAPAEERRARVLALVAALPGLAGAFLSLRRGEEPLAPDPALGHAADALRMLTGERPTPARARAFETYLNATVDHGLNASTFAARVVASTRADAVSALLAALGALKGPLHGGAPGPALDTVFAVRERAASTGRPLAAVAEERVHAALDAGERMMGFGHRVYRVRDPRADVLARALEALFPRPGDSPLCDDARVVEAAALRVLAERKPGRRIETNVEFYTALLLHALGVPSAAFTAAFALARAAGWTGHLLEQVAEDRLIRPRAAWRGRTRRWAPLEARVA